MKYIFVAIMILAFSGACFADNSLRIEELKKEQQKISQEIQSGQQYIQNKQIELLKTQGAIEILMEMDKEVKE